MTSGYRAVLTSLLKGKYSQLAKLNDLSTLLGILPLILISTLESDFATLLKSL